MDVGTSNLASSLALSLATSPGSLPDCQPASAARIRTLATLVANQIAAGEVVERPASVVKELVENALDAGGTRIVVELEAGGIELVRVTDDGAGMEPEDLPLAIAPHATSKIVEAQDLDRIGTLGFRGEALASIASVSRMSIRTRTQAGVGAWVLEVEGATQGTARPVAGSVGTSVSVRNLFFNTPVRRKFLRTAQTERERCADVVEHLSLAHPHVGFVLMVDGRTVQDVPVGQSPRQRVLSVLGKEVASQMVDVHADRFDDARGIALWGLAGLPSLARGSIKGQHVFVNGRPVRDRTIQHAISEAYRGLIEPGRYPTLVLMLVLSPEGVDVNVHPQKAEVRFRDGSMVHSTVLRALREALARADLTPTMGALRPSLAWGPESSRMGLPKVDLLGASASQTGLPLGLPLPLLEAESISANIAAANVTAAKFASYFSRFRPGQEQVALTLADADRSGSQDAGGRETTRNDSPEVFPNLSLDVSRVEAGATEAGGAAGSIGVVGWHADDARIVRRATSLEGNLLQVHNSYVVTQDEQGVVIIDQHALHERAMFEYLTQRVLAGNLESQRLLMAVVVRGSAAACKALLESGSLLERIGIEASALGEKTLGVHAFPSFLLERHVEVGEFVEELLRKAEAGELGEGKADEGKVSEGSVGERRQSAAEHALRDVLDMMSCKAAVKAGDRLTATELAELVKLREDVERSSNCPHGRPTSIRLTLRELARLFGRS